MPFHREVHEDKLTETINGVAMEIHRKLGNDHPEGTYREMLARGLRRAGLECRTEAEVDVELYDLQVGTRRVDLLVEDEVALELKAVKRTTADHETQLGANVHASGASRGLLINFGAPSIDITRFVTKEWLDEHA